MALFISNSEKNQGDLPFGLHPTAADRPGVAQPVPQRDVPLKPWRYIGLIVFSLLILMTAAWEWQMRGLELVPGDLGLNYHRWADLRRQIDQHNVPVVLLGDSRISYDTDLSLAAQLTGVRPLQLGLAGASGLPILEDLADDANFRGLAILGINEIIYFNPRGKRASEAIETSRSEPPSKRGSFLIQRAISPYLAMLDNDYSLSAILFRWAPNWRSGVEGPHDDLGKFQETGPAGQTWLWRRVEHDQNMSNFIRNYWIKFQPKKPLKPETIRAIFVRTKIAVEKIRARGGDVVIVRPPSGPALRALEEQVLPRSKGWDPLLTYAGVHGVHIDDLPAAQSLTLPEGSHLSRQCAAVFTDAYIRAVSKETPLLRLRPDAPRALSTMDCVPGYRIDVSRPDL